ncbi:MAG: DUF4249 domain-containing protein [Prevotella sp.]|nr:DUF4249 domain-containing protein [Prevotella sp.]
MKKPFIFFLSSCLVAVLSSCEKEIPMDYHEVGSLYVAEATITQSGTKVRVSMTQSVTDNSRTSHTVDDATVVVYCKKYDYTETLKHSSKGIYTSTLKGEPGVTYDIDITVGDRHFTSSSTMQKAPEVNSFRFVWKKMLSERFLFGDLRIQDTPDQNSYYFMHIYRNGVGYRWAVMSDEKNRNGELQQLFQCTTERDMDKGDSDALQEGDQLQLEVRAIDKLSYDYLYSMQVMDNAGTNPIANFTGGCLGYFSAYYVLTFKYTFHRDEVEDE